MKKLILAFLLVACAALSSGCVVGQKITHAYVPEPAAGVQKDSLFPVSISVADKRPYILDSDKDPSFIGIYKSGFGIPYDVKTDGEIPLATVMKRDLAADLRSAGFNVVDASAERQIQVSIQEYNFNCYINCRVWHKLHVQIKDAQGNALHSHDVILERKVDGSAWVGPKGAMEKEIPQIYANMIRSIVRDNSETMAVLRRAGEGQSQSASE